MATYRADTNLLLRLPDPTSAQHSIAIESLARLIRQGDEVFLTAQNFIEFWAVATRPLDANGFGWTGERTAREISELQERFPLLADSPEIFVNWLHLVRGSFITGKRVHDARLVAVLRAYKIENLLTFNTADFAAFTWLSCINPASLVNTGK